jgi:hypothetical protein
MPEIEISFENVLWFEMKVVTLHPNSVPEYWAKFKNHRENDTNV